MNQRCSSFCILKLFVLAILTSGAAGCNYPQNPGAYPLSSGQPARPSQVSGSTVSPGLAQTLALASGGTPRPSSQPSAATSSVTAPDLTLPPGENTCDLAAPGVPVDVTVPDDTEMLPGQAFTKVWRLMNAGRCTWTSEYRIELFSGDQMGASQQVFLPGPVPPGETVDISVDMIAPQAPGVHQGSWKLRNPQNQWFGIGPSGDAAFWVRIVVMPPPSTGTAPSPAIAPSPTAEAVPQIQARGILTLTLDAAADLDFSQQESGDDVSFSLSDTGQPKLVSSDQAELAVFGPDEPGFEACSGAELEPTEVPLEDELLDTYLCYRTNLGLPGRAQILRLDTEEEMLVLDILTWSLP